MRYEVSVKHKSAHLHGVHISAGITELVSPFADKRNKESFFNYILFIVSAIFSESTDDEYKALHAGQLSHVDSVSIANAECDCVLVVTFS